MASGHVNRTNRPNTWLHRPTCMREENPCQLGAVHTWHTAAQLHSTECPQLGGADITTKTVASGFDPLRTSAGLKSRSAASPNLILTDPV
jgi:hypothetical protein